MKLQFEDAEPENREPDDDFELDAVVNAIRGLDPSGERFGQTIRETLDRLYDGQHTGRFRWDQLMKTEKTHMGTLVEISLQREFEFLDGVDMDYRIAGVDVDCKFSQRLGGWEIPPEAYAPRAASQPHICLVVTASDTEGTWLAGIVRARREHLRTRPDGSLGVNRDNKVRLAADFHDVVRWLWGSPTQRPTLPENLLLHLDEPRRDRILTACNGHSRTTGQQRVNALFREVRGRVILRGTILTVAQQDDGMKRIRDARQHLAPEGIIILGHQDDDPRIARELGLPVPRKGSAISARVVPAETDQAGPTALIAGRRWRIASAGDPVLAAPKILRRPSQAAANDS